MSTHTRFRAVSQSDISLHSGFKHTMCRKDEEPIVMCILSNCLAVKSNGVISARASKSRRMNKILNTNHRSLAASTDEPY